MTTELSAQYYLSQHLFEMQGREFAVFNPHGKPVEELPTIYGFNNGGSREWLYATLIAEDGTGLGGHICSHEAYMPHDLGVLTDTRPDRHESFRAHYPNGYKMTFISYANARKHEGLMKALKLNQEKAKLAAESLG